MRKTLIITAASIGLSVTAFARIAVADTAAAQKAPITAGASPVTASSSSSAPPAAASTSGAAPSASIPAAGPASSASFSDEQLESYIGAQRELTVLNASGAGLASPTPETQAQIAAILQRYSIDGQTYNKISATAKTDKKLSARLAALKADSTVKTQ